MQWCDSFPLCWTAADIDADRRTLGFARRVLASRMREDATLPN